MKKIVMISNLDMIDKLMDKVDVFLFGIEDMSVNMPLYLSVEQLIKVCDKLKNSSCEVMVSLNKNMHNRDLRKLKVVLDVLNNIDIAGIFYYDIALVNMKSEGYIKAPLIWNQEHLVTNYATCNFYLNNGVDGACLSSEITLDEIKEIVENTELKIIVPIFGYIPMFTSKRTLVNNYLDTFNIKSSDSIHTIKKEGYTYVIVDDKTKTEVYSGNILNCVIYKDILRKYDVDYVLFNSFNIADNDFIRVIDLYDEMDSNNVDDTTLKLDNLFVNNDRGFFYKETIFKVKKNDK